MAQYPSDQQPRPRHSATVDDDDVRYLDGLDTKLADGDVISILPAVAGG